MHKCPNCGKPTEGTYSEGGVLFALCPDCYQKLYGEKETKGGENK